MATGGCPSYRTAALSAPVSLGGASAPSTFTFGQNNPVTLTLGTGSYGGRTADNTLLLPHPLPAKPSLFTAGGVYFRGSDGSYGIMFTKADGKYGIIFYDADHGDTVELQSVTAAACTVIPGSIGRSPSPPSPRFPSSAAKPPPSESLAPQPPTSTPSIAISSPAQPSAPQPSPAQPSAPQPSPHPRPPPRPPTPPAPPPRPEIEIRTDNLVFKDGTGRSIIYDLKIIASRIYADSDNVPYAFRATSVEGEVTIIDPSWGTSAPIERERVALERVDAYDQNDNLIRIPLTGVRQPVFSFRGTALRSETDHRKRFNLKLEDPRTFNATAVNGTRPGWFCRTTCFSLRLNETETIRREIGDEMDYVPRNFSTPLRRVNVTIPCFNTSLANVTGDPGGSDVLLLTDATASMATALAVVKANAAAIRTALMTKARNLGLGLAWYRNFFDPPPFQVDLSIGSYNSTVFSAAISKWSAPAGGDSPEMHIHALYTIATNASAVRWRPGTTRWVVLWGDSAGYGSTNPDGSSEDPNDYIAKQRLNNTINALKAARIRVIIIDMGAGTGYGLNMQLQAERITNATGGLYVPYYGFTSAPLADVIVNATSRGLASVVSLRPVAKACDDQGLALEFGGAGGEGFRTVDRGRSVCVPGRVVVGSCGAVSSGCRWQLVDTLGLVIAERRFPVSAPDACNATAATNTNTTGHHRRRLR
ncbi:hypothetical protein HYH03_018589 [Edaphochlamys debaryana]|uniref:VWFA domain-containing protein n=1 Tax=Edaphochlamys debaryana TaxID=47281 RepID=A0A835XG88_9CHLO|nr:hypothetical protein HYH03_018589 [Edaphochlamys debaryana]|eukprot:KAG2482482.1 hypothetical protein HYH03_018589 [Edaphochlamys debaryana]